MSHQTDKFGQPIVGKNSFTVKLPPIEISGAKRTAAQHLPEILINDRQLPDLSGAGIRALEAENNPPKLFVGRNGIAAIDIDPSNQRASICTIDHNRLRGDLARAAVWHKVNTHGQAKSIYPPFELAIDINSRPKNEIPFPVLLGVIETPSLRADGSIISEPGYDSASRLYYAPKAGFRMPELPDVPLRDDATVAAKFILDELLYDFKFVDHASCANYLALLLTPIVRPAINGPVPICMIDAPAAGSGKSLLADVLAIITTGSLARMRPLSESEEEIRKSLSSLLSANPSDVVVFDNLKGTVKSAALAEVVTASEWVDRKLGESRDISARVRCTWLATGNNISVGGDLARRCYHVRIDTECTNPFERSGFRHPNLKEWVAEHRGKLVAALLVMARAWFMDGEPVRATALRLGSFERWSTMIAGILEYAGVEGFMENRADFYEDGDTESSDWEEFLLALRDQFERRSFTTADIVTAINTGRAPAVKSALPTGCAGTGHEPNAKSLSMSLKHRRNRRYGKSGAHLVRVTKKRPTLWEIEVERELVIEDAE